MDNLNITIIQSSLHWENVEQNLEQFSQKIAGINQATDLIVLPEMFNTGFTMNTKSVAEPMGGITTQWMQKTSKEKNCVITGSIIIAEKENYFNRLILMRPDGEYETYDKRHLFRMANEDDYFTAGSKRLITKIKEWKICPLICYDLRFPVWSRNKWLKKNVEKQSEGQLLSVEYDILIYVANWPERRAHAWKSLLLARAIENQAYVIGVNRVGADGNSINYSGDSAVIDFMGKTLSKTNANQACIETITLNQAELEEARRSFPVGLDTDDFTIN